MYLERIQFWIQTQATWYPNCKRTLARAAADIFIGNKLNVLLIKLMDVCIVLIISSYVIILLMTCYSNSHTSSGKLSCQ